jgi:biotin carboxylase
VTNTCNAQAYAIIRALRPHAKKIVATMEGENRLAARLSHAANSRLVDKRCYTPSPENDWRAGRIQRDNTHSEEAYIQAVIKICERETIDTIYPSFDPQVYVFSKNKERFEKLGVLVPVPDYETLMTPLDKYQTIRVAQEVGFPCPRMYLPESDDDLRKVTQEIGFPLVIKPRFTAGARGTRMVRNFAELSEMTHSVKKRHGLPMVQEYIPGGRIANFHLVIDRNGELKSIFSGTKHRNFRIKGGFGTGQESTAPHPYLVEATRLVRKIGWWGGVLVETKVDPRDEIPKLMEINPRFGNRLWVRTELGINEPLMCLNIARGKAVETAHTYPVGIVLVDPIEDVLLLGFHLLDLLLYRIRIGILRREPLDPLNAPLTLKELVHSFRHTYFAGNKKVFNPYFRHFFQDPWVSLLWWVQYSLLTLRAAGQLGR